MSVAMHAPSRRDAQSVSLKPRVLIVEDETALVELLRYNLEQAGFRVSVAYDGEEALASVQEDTPDLILLDWMLPLMSGIEVCRQLRRQTATANLPIIMLTARGEEGDRVRGLDAGADDYLVKPFSFSELSARIRALLRRGQSEPTLHLALDDLRMDLTTRTVKRGPQTLDLTAREFELLECLLRNQGRVVSRETLAREVWKETSRHTPMDNVIDVHMFRLRRKLEEGFSAKLLHTVRGAGFVLKRDKSV